MNASIAVNLVRAVPEAKEALGCFPRDKVHRYQPDTTLRPKSFMGLKAPSKCQDFHARPCRVRPLWVGAWRWWWWVGDAVTLSARPYPLPGGVGSREGLPETHSPWCEMDHIRSRRTANILPPEDRQGSLEGGQVAVLSALEKTLFGQVRYRAPRRLSSP